VITQLKFSDFQHLDESTAQLFAFPALSISHKPGSML
jgi:hypothetical protein